MSNLIFFFFQIMQFTSTSDDGGGMYATFFVFYRIHIRLNQWVLNNWILAVSTQFYIYQLVDKMYRNGLNTVSTTVSHLPVLSSIL